MFASLGLIVFEVLQSPEVMSASREHNYAEHKVVETKPILQWIGDELEEITLTLGMHIKFTNPAQNLQDLRNAASAHKALSFIYGNGYYRGKYVITKINVDYKQMSDLGDLIYVSCDLTLKEWVPDTPIAPQNPPFVPPAVLQTIDNTDFTQQADTQTTLQLPDQGGLTPFLINKPPNAAPPSFNFLDVSANTTVRSE